LLLTKRNSWLNQYCVCLCVWQEPAGIFELIEVVGNGTYGQVFKVSFDLSANIYAFIYHFVTMRCCA